MSDMTHASVRAQRLGARAILTENRQEPTAADLAEIARVYGAQSWESLPGDTQDLLMLQFYTGQGKALNETEKTK